jgi:two-component sensor histidine kinase
LIHVLLAPYISDDKSRFSLGGDDIPIGPTAVTPLALVINELATNAMKYGALQAEGMIAVECTLCEGQFVLVWTETGTSEVDDLDQSGFGTRLTRTVVETQLGGRIDREWAADGLVVTIAFDLSRL